MKYPIIATICLVVSCIYLGYAIGKERTAAAIGAEHDAFVYETNRAIDSIKQEVVKIYAGAYAQGVHDVLTHCPGTAAEDGLFNQDCYLRLVMAPNEVSPSLDTSEQGIEREFKGH